MIDNSPTPFSPGLKTAPVLETFAAIVPPAETAPPVKLTGLPPRIEPLRGLGKAGRKTERLVTALTVPLLAKGTAMAKIPVAVSE